MSPRKYLSLPLAVLVLALTDTAAAQPSDQRPAVSFDLIFHDLKAQGRWLQLRDGRWAWQPRGVGPRWRPFIQGAWVISQLGWYWLSDYPWGYVTSHYGRWAWREQAGWVWIPGNRWSPAKVLWAQSRHGLAWRPLPEPSTSPTAQSKQLDLWIVANWNDLRRSLIPPPDRTRQVGTSRLPLEAIVVSTATVSLVRNLRPSEGWQLLKGATSEGSGTGQPDPALVEAATGRRLEPIAIVPTRHRRELLIVGRDRTILVAYRPVIREAADEIQAFILRKAKQYRRLKQIRARKP